MTQAFKLQKGNPLEPQYYELKIPFTSEDEYGNIATFYRKEIVTEENLQKEYLEACAKKDELRGRLEEIAKVK